MNTDSNRKNDSKGDAPVIMKVISIAITINIARVIAMIIVVHIATMIVLIVTKNRNGDVSFHNECRWRCFVTLLCATASDGGGLGVFK